MGKFLLTMAFASLLLLLVGTTKAPNDMMFWLASSAPTYQLIRGLLAFFLALQIITRPPRRLWFRLLAGMMATAVGAWTLQSNYLFAMPALDTFAFLSASIAIGITALEPDYDHTKQTSLDHRTSASTA
jgi:hypothetical protein